MSSQTNADALPYLAGEGWNEPISPDQIVKFRQLVAMHRSTYQSLPATKSKWIRYSIMKLITEEIRNRGGRFLYEAFDCNGKCIGWTYADFPKISRKIYNLLRKKSVIRAKAKEFKETTSQHNVY